MAHTNVINCPVCKKSFSPRGCPSDVASGRGKFCSRGCSRKSLVKLPQTFICPSCDKKFPNRYGKISKYCSKNCLNLSMIGKPAWNKGLKSSSATKKKQSKAKIGGIPWNKGKRGVMPIPWNKDKGIGKIEHTKRMRVDYKDWRNAVLKRDGWKCQMAECKTKIFKKENRLEVHHIKTYSKYPELRLEIKNGITLCKGCHLLTKTKEEKFEELFYKT